MTILVRESSSHAIINADNSGYSIYMQRVKEKNKVTKLEMQ